MSNSILAIWHFHPCSTASWQCLRQTSFLFWVLIIVVAKIKLNGPTCGGTLIHLMFFKSLPAEFGQLEPYRNEAQMWAICLGCHLVSFHHDLATLMKATNMQSTCLWKDICLLSQGNCTLLPKFPASLSVSEDTQIHGNGKHIKHLQSEWTLTPEARLFFFEL